MSGSRSLLLEHMRRSPHTAVARLDGSWRLRWANEGFLRVLELPEVPVGRPLEQFLAPGTRAPRDARSGEVLLSFRASREAIHTLACRAYALRRGYLLVGERPLVSHSELVDRMARAEQHLTRMNRELQERLRELEEAQADIRALEELLPICASCKKIRDDTGYWRQLEEYLHTHGGPRFTHGLCPDCARTLYPDLFEK
ncbi:MAG: hypothetical protein Kow0092_20950 [Deferrisomatales bacterium]